MAIISEYIDLHRADIHDDHGRAWLLPTKNGRPSTDAVYKSSYLATLPSRHTACPHGKERTTCDWIGYPAASKCHSSRSHHKVRTSAIA